jgi:flagellar basal-body rod protein FlgB
VIENLTNSTAIPVLERLLQFSAQRHRIISNNIANLPTPGFRPADVSVQDFQRQLGKAIDARRAGDSEAPADLVLRSSREVEVIEDRLILHPQPLGENILFHDRNDRDVERSMQALVEIFMTYRAAAQLLKNRMDDLHTAIRERL